jgi:hypothetical protein
MNTFEDFLKEKHAEDYHGLDDDMPDAFDSWLTDDLQVDDIILYADQYRRHAVVEDRKKIEAVIVKEQQTWGKSSIGEIAVTSIQEALKDYASRN